MARFMIRRDLPQCVNIMMENIGGTYEIHEQVLLAELKKQTVVGQVAEIELNEHVSDVVGFMTYEIADKYLEITNFFLRKDTSFSEVGVELLDKLRQLINDPTRVRRFIQFAVSEYDSVLHTQLRDYGMRAKRVLRSYYDDGSAAYLFELKPEMASIPACQV